MKAAFENELAAKPLGLVACDVVKNEFLAVMERRGESFRKERKEVPGVIPVFPEYALHANPKEMPAALNAAAAGLAEKGAGRVVLGYGLCSNGTVGVGCPGGLSMPRCHDCVSMLLGSPARYMRVFSELPGTLFVSDGWYRNGGTLLDVLENKYIPRMGERLAWKGMRLEIQNYKRLCFIVNGVGDVGLARERTKESAAAFGKEYVELAADLGFFERLLDLADDPTDIVSLGPGEVVREEFFYRSLSAPAGPGTAPAPGPEPRASV
ncbi:MAG: DUF1638 domain-containing protein [Deltaproteobacteria bacterium]|jgi:hypothetical protein|nr:DUF1638 domain-containing protein [Deltaproteobacteria bacterium]